MIDGDAHMRRRPIAPLLQALQALGVEAEAPSGCPPVRLRGRGGVDGGRVEVDAGLSSQYVSALLMLAACARAPVEVALKGADIGARGYVELTLAAMKRFGASAEAIGSGAWRVQATGYSPCDLAIEPDASAATYVWAAERLTHGQIDIGLAPKDFTQPDASAPCGDRRLSAHAFADRRLADAGRRTHAGGDGGLQRHPRALHRDRQPEGEGVRPARRTGRRAATAEPRAGARGNRRAGGDGLALPCPRPLRSRACRPTPITAWP